jgi:hypothetical protein
MLPLAPDGGVLHCAMFAEALLGSHCQKPYIGMSFSFHMTLGSFWQRIVPQGDQQSRQYWTTVDR